MARRTKTLKDVAKIYKDKALQAINPGIPYKGYKKTGSSKAYKTGNLFNKIAANNQSQRMFAYDKQTDKYTLKFNVSPNGAEYGKYVNYGTRYMDKRPFAQLAAESPEFKLAINEFMNGKVNEKLAGMFDEMDKKAEDAGLTVK